jgi:hypothetical protein
VKTNKTISALESVHEVEYNKLVLIMVQLFSTYLPALSLSLTELS